MGLRSRLAEEAFKKMRDDSLSLSINRWTHFKVNILNTQTTKQKGDYRIVQSSVRSVRDTHFLWFRSYTLKLLTELMRNGVAKQVSAGVTPINIKGRNLFENVKTGLETFVVRVSDWLTHRTETRPSETRFTNNLVPSAILR